MRERARTNTHGAVVSRGQEARARSEEESGGLTWKDKALELKVVCRHRSDVDNSPCANVSPTRALVLARAGTMEAWMQNIAAVEAESGVPVVQKTAPNKQAQRSAPAPARGPTPAPPGKAGPASSSGLPLAAVSVVVLAGVAAWLYYRKRE